MITKSRQLALFAGIAAFANAVSAGTIVINGFAPIVPPNPTIDTWYQSDVRTGGTATIRDLTGVGGNLETGQPLAKGAARLTTDSTTAAKAEVATYADFGLASSVFSSINLNYSYFKSVNAELFAAPAIKLTIFSSGGTGDNYGTLIYEPNWNQAVNGSSVVPSGSWQNISIDQNTGAGSTGGGGWWWNGGFEVASGFGGPPMRSLAEWLAVFQGSDPTDFAAAHVVGLSMGVGTYNINQDDYFDAVSIRTGNIDKTYDFELQSVPDGGATLALLALSFAGMIGCGLRLRNGKD